MSIKRALIVEETNECPYRLKNADGYWFLKDRTRTKTICGKMLQDSQVQLKCESDEFPVYCPLIVIDMEE